MKKYRFLYLGLAAAILIVFSIIIYFNKDLGEQIVLYCTAGVVLVFACVRFGPLMKHTSNKTRLVMNAIEIFSNFILAGIMIYIAVKGSNLIWLYKYILSLILAARGVIFLVEAIYFEGEKEPSKFVIHLIFICCASAIVAINNFDITTLRYLVIILAFLSGVYCGVDSGFSYNNYRKNYVVKQKSNNVSDDVSAPVIQPVLDEQPEEQVPAS